MVIRDKIGKYVVIIKLHCDIIDDFAVQLYNIEKPNAPVSLGY